MYVLLKLVHSTFSLGVSVLFTIVFTKNNNVVCAHVKYYVVISTFYNSFTKNNNVVCAHVKYYVVL
jgi:hypothetical protein